MTRTANNPARRGTALVLVIGLVAAVAVLGLAYISANGVDVQAAFNMSHSSRARYLAESGVDHALYWLSQPDPPGANADGYWPGANGQSVDDTTDYYDVTVTRIAGENNRYRIVSTGHCVSYGRELTYRVTATASVTGSTRVSMPYALHVDGFTWLSGQWELNGDTHVNGTFLSSADHNGNVTSSGLLMLGVNLPNIYAGLGWQSPVPLASVQWSHYQSYTLDGAAATAQTWNDDEIDDDFDRAGPGPGNGRDRDWHITASNPGGVLNCTHHDDRIRIRDDVEFTGTIVIDGDVYLDGDDIELTAVAGFPAIVCSGDLVLSERNADVEINGAVIVGGTVRTSGNTDNFDLKINGPLQVGGSLSFWDNVDEIEVNHSDARNWLYDFGGSGSAAGGTVSIESWTDG